MLHLISTSNQETNHMASFPRTIRSAACAMSSIAVVMLSRMNYSPVFKMHSIMYLFAHILLIL